MTVVPESLGLDLGQNPQSALRRLVPKLDGIVKLFGRRINQIQSARVFGNTEIANLTETKIAFFSRTWDEGDLFDAANNRLVCHVPGWYAIWAFGEYFFDAGGTFRTLYVRKNSGPTLNGPILTGIRTPPYAADIPILPCMTIDRLGVTEYVELSGQQDSGGPVSAINCFLGIHLLMPS